MLFHPIADGRETLKGDDRIVRTSSRSNLGDYPARVDPQLAPSSHAIRLLSALRRALQTVNQACGPSQLRKPLHAPHAALLQEFELRVRQAEPLFDRFYLGNLDSNEHFDGCNPSLHAIVSELLAIDRLEFNFFLRRRT